MPACIHPDREEDGVLYFDRWYNKNGHCLDTAAIPNGLMSVPDPRALPLLSLIIFSLTHTVFANMRSGENQ
ncbi:MAG: hypothetical protein A2W28_04180 [Gammaproteobacteria bacterium RBG_16_51_14]|nr:MAG: hypothetical protein A2W28_04180 [Gammaproteobacteria bacterium RBG_16_51_14]